MNALLRYRHLASHASGSVGAMAVQAFTSFVLQVIAASTIGASGYGKLTIIIGLQSTLTALRAGVDDAPLVLEHHDDALRPPVLAAQYGSVLAVGVIALTVGLATSLTTQAGALVLALMVTLWSLEEMGRRSFMKDQRFTALVVNDMIYAVGAVTAVGVQYVLIEDLTLINFLWAVCVGSALSFTAALLQLPRGTLGLRGISTSGLGAVVHFAAWRSGQVIIRPLSITLTRVALAGITSATVLGNLETARLILQPVWVAIAGLGPFLLTHYVRGELDDRAVIGVRRLVPVTGALMALGTAWGICAVLATGLFQNLFAGDDITVDRAAVAAWTVFYVASASGLPIMNLLVARKDTFGAFVARVADGVCGLSLAVVLSWLIGPESAPVGLAVGALMGAVMMWRRSEGDRGALQTATV